mmetsp:Transcript_25697/g.60458  ORF Transcript_25697/g.60458 Transcript_25697/m.60458 type:complete len:202 (-) Transcript_25697:917-1522(-)
MAEVVLVDGHAIQDLGINLFVFDINQIHLLTDTLHGGFGTESGDIGTDKTMGFSCNGFGIDIVVQFHVACVNAEHFQAAILIGDTNVDFTVKTSKTTQGRIDSIGTIGRTNDNHRSTLLQTVHERQHLRDDTAFHFTIGLFTLGRNGVNLIDKDNCGGILFGFFKGLSQVGFRFTSHFGHDFRTIDQKEECTSFIGHGTGN